MLDSTYVFAQPQDGVIAAKIKCEKVADREASVIQSELVPIFPSGGYRVVLDLSDVMLLTSVGLGMLVTLRKKCVEKGGKLAIHSVTDDIMNLLKVTRLSDLLMVKKDLAAAMKAVK